MNLIKIIFVLFLIQSGLAQFQKITNHGSDIYYRIIGKGSPLLILGGGPGDISDRYLSLCELLAQNFECILVEQRGTGKSAPQLYNKTNISLELTLEDFEIIRKQLNINKWNVLGFSYGGFLASAYTDKYPESVSSIILLGSMGFDLNVFNYFNDNIKSGMSSEDIKLFDYWNDSLRISSNPRHALVERIKSMMPGYFFDKKLSLETAQSIKDADFNFEIGNFIWDDIERTCTELISRKNLISQNVLIIQGRQDPLGENVAIELNKYYTNSRLVFIEKCGHYSWIEQPQKVFDTIRDFIR